MNDRELAFMEEKCIAAEEEYFKARPQFDTPERRFDFQAGFRRAWKLRNKEDDDHREMMRDFEARHGHAYTHNPQRMTAHGERQYIADRISLLDNTEQEDAIRKT